MRKKKYAPVRAFCRARRPVMPVLPEDRKIVNDSARSGGVVLAASVLEVVRQTPGGHANGVKAEALARLAEAGADPAGHTSISEAGARKVVREAEGGAGLARLEEMAKS